MSDKPKLLDLYCGGGGCSMGYSLAGFEVIGVDKYPQPKYPFEFIQANAFDVLNDQEFISQFDAIHASPVCKGYSVLNAIRKNDYDNDIPEIRIKLIETGLPYSIENVPGAPLFNYVILCGSMFGLRVIRHRLFECNPVIAFPPFSCSCEGKTNSHRGISSFEKGAKNITVTGHNFKVKDGQKAMGIDWMGQKGLAQAIPPAYTKWIGEQMLKAIV